MRNLMIVGLALVICCIGSLSAQGLYIGAGIGNTFFGSVFDISSAVATGALGTGAIISKACENMDFSRNGVLYLQNNLGIGAYQPEAVIDCSKIDLPFLEYQDTRLGLDQIPFPLL